MTKPQSTTEPNDEPCPFCGVTPVRRDHVYRYGSIAEHPEDSYCPLKNCTIGINAWNTRSPASAAPVVKAQAPKAAHEIAQQVCDVLGTEYPKIQWPMGTIKGIAFDVIRKYFPAAATAAPVEHDSNSLLPVVAKAAKEPCRNYARGCQENQPDESYWCAPCSARKAIRHEGAR